MKTLNQLPEQARRFIETMQMSARAISPITTLAFAKAFADLAMLPSSKVESDKELGDLNNSSVTASFAIKQFYAISCEAGIRDTVYNINEAVVLDVNNILEAARRFYLTRYNILYGSYYYSGVGPGLERVFGLDQYLTKDDIAILANESENFLRIYNQVRDLIIAYQG